MVACTIYTAEARWHQIQLDLKLKNCIELSNKRDSQIYFEWKFHDFSNEIQSTWSWRDSIIMFQASDSAWDGTRTHPSSLAEVLELLICRLYGGADGIGLSMVIGMDTDTGTGIGIGIVEPGGGGCKLVGGGGGGAALVFNLINSNCRFRFAWNFNNSSYWMTMNERKYANHQDFP